MTGPTHRRDADEALANALKGLKLSEVGKGGGGEDDLDRITRATVDMARARGAENLTKSLLPPERSEATPPATGGEPVLIQGMKLMGTVIENSLNQLTKTAGSSADAATKAQLDHMKETLTEMRATLQNPSNPMQTWKEVGEVLNGMASNLKENMGISGHVQNSDLPGMLQLKNMEIDLQDRKLQHEERILILQQQFQVDIADREATRKDNAARFWATHKLSIAQAQADSAQKANALGQLQDLAGATIEAIKEAKGGAPATAVTRQPSQQKKSAEATAEEQPEAPTEVQIECPNCSELLTIKVGDEDVTCLQCGEVHKVGWPPPEEAQ